MYKISGKQVTYTGNLRSPRKVDGVVVTPQIIAVEAVYDFSRCSYEQLLEIAAPTVTTWFSWNHPPTGTVDVATLLAGRGHRSGESTPEKYAKGRKVLRAATVTTLESLLKERIIADVKVTELLGAFDAETDDRLTALKDAEKAAETLLG